MSAARLGRRVEGWLAPAGTHRLRTVTGGLRTP